jgi:hypothetical protein
MRHETFTIPPAQFFRYEVMHHGNGGIIQACRAKLGSKLGSSTCCGRESSAARVCGDVCDKHVESGDGAIQRCRIPFCLSGIKLGF